MPVKFSKLDQNHYIAKYPLRKTALSATVSQMSSLITLDLVSGSLVHQ